MFRSIEEFYVEIVTKDAVVQHENLTLCPSRDGDTSSK
jgi:hypothetical protein